MEEWAWPSVSRTLQQSFTFPPDKVLWPLSHQPLILLKKGEEPRHVLNSSPDCHSCLFYGYGTISIQKPRPAWWCLPSTYPCLRSNPLELGSLRAVCLYLCIWLVLRRHNTNINNLLIELLLHASLYARCSTCVISLNPHLQVRKQA